MSESASIRAVKIDPVGCFKQALELVQGDYWLLLGVSAVGTLIGGLVPVVLIGPMMCGIYMCFLRKYRGRDFDFDLLFKGFDLFVPGLIASLIMTGATMVALIPGFIIMFAGMLFSMPAAAAAESGQSAVPVIASLGVMLVASLLMVSLILVVGLFFFFTFPLIVDRKLTGTAAVATSARAVAKNFWGVLGLMLINVVLGLVGVLACYVGTFFVLPISYAAMTIAYRKVFPEIGAEPLSAVTAAATPEPPTATESPA